MAEKKQQGVFVPRIEWDKCGYCPYHNKIVAAGELLHKCNAENMERDCYQWHNQRRQQKGLAPSIPSWRR